MNSKGLKYSLSITTFLFFLLTSSLYTLKVFAGSLSQLLPDEKNTIQVFQKAAPKVVYVHRLTKAKIIKPGEKVTHVSAGTGSGIVWDRQGHIVTNFHVTQGAEALSITLGKLTFPAKVIGVEPRRDIAVLQVKSPKALEIIKNITPFQLVKNRDLLVGQKAIAIGNPFGLDHSLTVGVISALKRQVPGIGGVTIRNMIQTDASINPGNSGGPLLDSRGQLLGMNTAIYSNSGSSAGIGFAVSADDLQQIVPQIIEHGRVALAGIGIQRVEPAKALKKGIKNGVLIAEVLPHSPAAKVGLQGTFRDHWGRLHLGDVVTRVNGHQIRDYDDLYHQLSRVKVGRTISLTVDRQGHLLDYEMKTIDITAFRLRE